MRNNKEKSIVYRMLLTFTVALALDSLSKAWIEQTLILHHPVPVIGDLFRLTLSYNTGVAFSLFEGGGSVLLIVTSIIILGLVVWVFLAVCRGQISTTTVWFIGLIMGGAVGNFVDRLPDRRVTDFLDLGIGATRWPTFNLADTFIVFGVLFFLLTTLPEKHLPKKV